MKQKSLIYHCGQCNELFTVEAENTGNVVCVHCGESPFPSGQFKSVSQVKKLEEDSPSHGVPGVDTADFISLQKVRRQKQGRLILVMWFGVLALGVGCAVYFQNRRDESQEAAVVAKNQREIKDRKNARDISDCLQLFDVFFANSQGNDQSNFVLGGVQKLLKMRLQQQGIDVEKFQAPLKLIDAKHSDSRQPRVVLHIADANNQKFEALFAQESGVWRLDWEQHVRYSEVNWNAFLLEKPKGSSFECRLFVRQSHISKRSNGGEIELIFYQPKMVLGERQFESPKVIVDAKHPDYVRLKELLASQSSSEFSQFLTQFDPPDMHRVRVLLEWVGDAQVELRLKKLLATDWRDSSAE